MFHDDCNGSWVSALFGTLFLSLMFFFSEKRGYNRGVKEVEDNLKDQELIQLRQTLAEMKRKHGF